MKKLKFSNGDTMHAIGLGTWKANGEKLKTAVKDALYAGYRHIDTAATYGNEEVIGEALAEVFSEGNIKREDVFITSKLWNDSHAEKDVIPALQDSLKRLKLDYLDLFLIHWPVAFKLGVTFPKSAADYVPIEDAPIIATWQQLERAKNEGLTKHIGVSNFSVKKLKDLVAKATIIPEMNQVELHPLLQQEALLSYCKSKNILVTGYSPLGSGDRSDAMKAHSEPNMMDIQTIKDIADNHDVPASQVLIAWHLHRGCAVIPKSTTKKHIISNFEASKVSLTADDMKKINALDQNYRYITGKFFEEPSKGYINLYDE